jgi:hypothetical protein
MVRLYFLTSIFAAIVLLFFSFRGLFFYQTTDDPEVQPAVASATCPDLHPLPAVPEHAVPPMKT